MKSQDLFYHLRLNINLVIEQTLLACLLNCFYCRMKDTYIHPIILREILRKYTFLMIIYKDIN